MESYRRLAPGDRYQIELLKESGFSIRGIASKLGFNPSTILRELRKCVGRYKAEQAQETTEQRWESRSESQHKIRGLVRTFIDQQLLADWSPEQVSSCLSLYCQKEISHHTIYRYIERDRTAGGKLKSHLRILRKQRKDRKKPNWAKTEAFVKNKTPISERPKVVEKRNRIGDYERDTVLGAKNGRVLLTIVDRKSRYVHIACLEKKNAKLAHQATVELLKGRPIQTLTNDNGTEFAYHHKTSEKLKVPIYFSRAYAAWERGANENLNGLLRQYIPKRKPIPDLSKSDLRRLELKLNLRPRKCLGWRTPYEIYHSSSSGRVLR